LFGNQTIISQVQIEARTFSCIRRLCTRLDTRPAHVAHLEVCENASAKLLDCGSLSPAKALANLLDVSRRSGSHDSLTDTGS